jgi:putative transposase
MNAAETLGQQVGIVAACEALAVSRATVYRRRQPRPEARPRPRPARSLSAFERQTLLETLNAEAYADLAPAQIHAKLLDTGIYLASPRTMYRVLAEEDQVRERRNLRRHPRHVKPELVATAPNQVWSWDITKLLTTTRGWYLYLYVLLDIFSRYVVGWLLAEHENSRLAQRLIEESCDKQHVKPGQLTLHADRGSPMIAHTTAQLLAELGIAPSHSRPHVSNDNPYSEAQFKTLKYRPDFPRRFESFAQALEACEALLAWYNTEHQHSGIAYLTPEQVHYGQAAAILAQRQQVLDAAYARDPQRFPQPPRVLALPSKVWINPPAQELLVTPVAQ